ncbi:hypothetical protein EDD22DRAFT_1003870 [Suillus occidentalis]|nr:hypothetical protein EDD22DRAFT_1003870 [Suillus occidentalis]
MSLVVSACPRQILPRLTNLNSLLLPDLNFAIFRHFVRPSLAVFNRLGFLAMRRSSECMTSFGPGIKSCDVSGNLVSGQTPRSSSSRNNTDPAVIPDRNSIRLPVDAHFEVNILGDLVEQEIENGVGFRFEDTADGCATLLWTSTDHKDANTYPMHDSSIAVTSRLCLCAQTNGTLLLNMDQEIVT